MGLDVYASRRIKHIEDPRVSEIDDLTKVYSNGFDEQFGDLVDGDYYESGDEEWFCRMGYGRYGHFRDQLAKLGGWKKAELNEPEIGDDDFQSKLYDHTHPHVAGMISSADENGEVFGSFVEVVLFSDCEGFICAKICEKLHNDFVEHQVKAESLFSESPDYMDMYNGLRDAFKFGSDGGFVRYS